MHKNVFNYSSILTKLNMYWMDYLGIDTDHDSGVAREKNTERLYIRCIP